MAAGVEWIVGTIRAGQDFESHGDSYEFSCTINLRGDEAELIGGCGEITPQILRDIKAALLAQGITKVRWMRANNAPRDIVVEHRDDMAFPLVSSELVLGSQATN